MADEPKKDHPEDIESILSDLDSILSDMGSGAEQVSPEPSAPIEAPKPVPAPVKASPIVDLSPVPPPTIDIPLPTPKAAAPVESPKPVEPPKAKVPPPPTIDIPMPSAGPNIELAPREGMIKPPEKKPEPPKPAAKLPNQTPIELSFSTPEAEPPKASPPPPPPAPAPAPVAAKPEAPTPAPVPAAASSAAAPAAAPTAVGELPADTPKEQIRRVAYIYTLSGAEVKVACAAFLSQAARTISKKPIFLREVLSHEVSPSSDPNAVLQKALQVKASSILAIVEDWPGPKIDEMSEACSRAGVLFRAVAPADAQKKSTAVDIIVDMMLLPGEV